MVVFYILIFISVYSILIVNVAPSMASLVLSDSSQLSADGFENLPDQIMYPYAEPYDLQKHVFAAVTSDSQHLGADVNRGSFTLSITPDSNFVVRHILHAFVDDTLNLTCQVLNKGLPNGFVPYFNMSWSWPISSHDSKNRVTMVNQSGSVVNLVIQNLEEYDSGNYECHALLSPNLLLNQTLQVNVIKKKPACSSQMFMCPDGICIGKRYVCDGHQDCKNGEDESQGKCGSDPCETKLRCDDGRCIPKDWCCEQYHGHFQDANCTAIVKLECCHQLDKYLIHESHTMPEHHTNKDLGILLQTTIYIVLGCGVTFMFIITMLVLTIGRTHLKRFLISPPALRCGTHISPQRVNRSTRHHHGLQDVPLYELDCFPNHSINNCSPSLLSVSYNVHNDINFVGRPVDPPPYCEVLASPPREGPPPPYASQDNLSIDIRERETDSESSSGEADSLLDSTQTSIFGEHSSYVLSNTTLPITAAATTENSEISEFSTTLENLVDKVCKCNMPNSTHCHECETQTNGVRVDSQSQGSPPPYLSQKNLSRDIRERNSDSDCSIGEANSISDSLQPSVIREHTITPSTLPLVTAATRNLEISQTPDNLV